jgi:hypothetical protein
MVASCGTHHGATTWLNSEVMGLFCGCMTYAVVMYEIYATSFHVIIA